MARPEHRCKRQQARGLDLAGGMPADHPVAEALRAVRRGARPLELLEPEAARDPVALPVVRARVDEHAHAALEQARDVVLRRHGVLVHARVEGAPDVRRARAEVARGLDAQQCPDRGLIQVFRDHLAFEIAQFANAVLWDD